MDEDTFKKLRRLVTIEIRARFLVNALLRQKHECMRTSTGQDIDKAVDDLLDALELDKNFWDR